MLDKMMSIKVSTCSAVVGLFILGCATTREQVDIPKTPMGMGQVAIDAVTNDPEEESWLRVSPNGRFLLFNLDSTGTNRGGRGFLSGILNRKSGQQEILGTYKQNAVAMLEVGRPGKSIVSQAGARDPSWFPDSRSFVFSMLQGNQAMLASTTVGEETAAVRFISPTPCINYDHAPSISPDGKLIVFSTETVGEPATIATMDVQTTSSKCKVLFPGEYPQWSPASRRFAFTRVVNDHHQVFVFDEATNLLTQITFGEFDNYEPSWSPDGVQLAFTSSRNGDPDIYTIRADGTQLAQITQGPTHDRYPAWSKDGNIYFVSNAGGKIDIWRAQFRGR